MNDAENLTKLLQHLSPEHFQRVLVDRFGLAMPELERVKTKTEHCQALETLLTALSVAERQRIEEIAEQIILLTDGAGQDIVCGFRRQILDPSTF